jgi:peptidoglycan/LPS O-acetylase OafA/YrhL
MSSSALISDTPIRKQPMNRAWEEGRLALDDGNAEPGWLDTGRIPGLDGLRAVAVGLVLLAHAHQTAGFPKSITLNWLGRIGPIGVEVFFVISGFLITTLIFRELDRTGKLDIRAFYWRRAVRILPAYIALLVAVGVLQWQGRADLQARDWAAALTYTMNFLSHPTWEVGHAWSLSIEEHFYLVWPLIMAIPLAQLGPFACIACIVGCPVLRWVVLLAFPEATPMAELWTFTRLDVIAFGCLLAIIYRSPVSRSRLNSFAGTPVGGFAAFGLLCASLALSQFSAKFAVGVALTLNAACITALVWHVVRNDKSIVAKVLNWGPMIFVGTLSYSLYLWQQLFLNPHSDAFLCRFPQNISVAILAACGSYFLIEKPALQWRAATERRRMLLATT